MPYKTKTISYDSRVRLFWMLVAVCVLSLGVYIYSVNMTIRHTVARADLESKVSHMSAELSALEFEYITKRHGVDMKLAQEYGLKEVKNPAYVSRSYNNGLTLHTGR